MPLVDTTWRAGLNGDTEYLLETFGKFPVSLKERPDMAAGALVGAAVGNQMTTLRAMLDLGASVNSYYTEGQTALMAAAEWNRVDIISMLIDDYKADVDRMDVYGNTALMYAAREGKFEAVKTLLKYGADPHHQSMHGRTAKDLAKKHRKMKVYHFLEAI